MFKALCTIGVLVMTAIYFLMPNNALYTPTPSPTAQAVINDCSIAKNKGTVWVLTGDSLGSGWWVKTELGDNYFVTNAHVVAKYNTRFIADPSEIDERLVHSDIALINEDGHAAIANVVSVIFHGSIIQTRNTIKSITFQKDSYYDVAILKVTNHEDGFYDSLTQLDLSTHNTGEVGAVAGYVPNSANTSMLKTSKCMPIVHGEEVSVLISETEKGQQGQSGSAILNEHNQVVGLLTSTTGRNGDYLNVTKQTNGHKVHFREDNVNKNIYAVVTPVKWVHFALELAKESEHY